ncbi:MAG TPA: hypothetical protein VHT75_19585, partial [Acidimicrobiales bacterium]|nr:hypothetical protein [Acidimicrobiales bacterium]
RGGWGPTIGHAGSGPSTTSYGTPLGLEHLQVAPIVLERQLQLHPPRPGSAIKRRVNDRAAA